MRTDGDEVGKQPMRREEVIATAARIFHDKGFDGSSMQQISDELGILKVSLYHYTRSKEDLLYAVIETSHADVVANLEACRNFEGTASERLGAFIAGHIGIMFQERLGFTIYVRDSARLRPNRRMRSRPSGTTTATS